MSAQYAAELTRPQKAAALMMAVGPQQASDLLAFLSETEVEALAKEIAALREIPMGALQQVVNELQSQASSRNSMLEGGLDYARELLSRWQGPGGEVAARIAHGAVDAPFRFLADIEPAELVQVIAEEHPQTLALVLAHLPAGYAARVPMLMPGPPAGTLSGFRGALYWRNQEYKALAAFIVAFGYLWWRAG